MSEDKSVSIFIRETVNDAGLHYVPGPVLEARQKSDLKLDLWVNLKLLSKKG